MFHIPSCVTDTHTGEIGAGAHTPSAFFGLGPRLRAQQRNDYLTGSGIRTSDLPDTDSEISCISY